MVLYGIAWYSIVFDGIAWCCMGGVAWFNMVLDGIGWYHMVLHGI